MAKRGAEVVTEEQGADKKVKTSDPEGSWVCTYCTNVNWPLRTHCNKRGCNMPRDSTEHPEGSWACSNCSNVNWPKRTACNKCRLPRPGAGVGVAAPPPAFNASDHPSGSWSCNVCQNVNWPQRTTCNRKNCNAPRPAQNAQSMLPFFEYSNPQNASLLPNMGQMGGNPNMGQMGGNPNMGQMGGNPYMANMGGDMYSNPYIQHQMPPNAYQQQASPQHPVGSWECPLCHNVNWPKRTTCNKSGCGAPKPTTLGGTQMPQQRQQDPEGSWACPTCSNINWPNRTSCNRRGCDTPRPDDA